MYTVRLDERRRRRHKLRNLLQSILLVGGLGLIAAAIGWILAGPQGVAWVVLLAGVMLAFGPAVSPRAVLRLYGARRLRPHELPELHGLLAELARRAGLRSVPELHYVATAMPNAFAVGSPAASAIAVTDGLLRVMDLRELAGILAHEVSHIRNHDLWTMGLADVISRVTGAMATAGLFLLALNLPLVLTEQGTIPWALIVLLFFAPTINALLQLTLSRTREFDADLDAAGLTGDPAGLASALAKLQRFEAGFWERILLPGRRSPDPSLLRTHPDTGERIERLLSLQEVAPIGPFHARRRIAVPAHMAPPGHRPRWRASGLWY